MKIHPSITAMMEAEKAVIRSSPVFAVMGERLFASIDRRASEAQAFINSGTPAARLQKELDFWKQVTLSDLKEFVAVDPDTDAVTRELLAATLAGIEAAQSASTLNEKFGALREMVRRVSVTAPEKLDPDSMYWADVPREVPG